MKGKVAVKCTVLMASGRFAPFFEVISLARFAIIYHKRALYNYKNI